MNFSSVEFFIAEAWTGFRRSGIMSVVAIGTITVSLIIFGFFLMAIVNLNNVVNTLGGKLEIVAYVDAALDDWTVNKLRVEMTQIAGIEEVRYLSKDDAWREFKKDYQEKLNLAEIITENPLPNAFIVRVKSPGEMERVAKQISSFTIIDEVRYSGRLAERVKVLSGAVRYGGLLVVALLGLATLLIVVNTIRLTVLARQTDITIMRLVGATDAFIRWPFIIEGVIIGVIGSAISFVVIKLSADFIISRIQQAMPFLPLALSNRQLSLIYILVVAAGTFLGMLGGYISVSRSLKEPV